MNHHVWRNCADVNSARTCERTKLIAIGSLTITINSGSGTRQCPETSLRAETSAEAAHTEAAANMTVFAVVEAELTPGLASVTAAAADQTAAPKQKTAIDRAGGCFRAGTKNIAITAMAAAAACTSTTTTL